jgi:hypothetical protein
MKTSLKASSVYLIPVLDHHDLNHVHGHGQQSHQLNRLFRL